MTDEQAKQVSQEGLELLSVWARNIAMLPLEDWDRAFKLAESVGAIVDPTLYREYLYSDRSKIVRNLIRAAIQLKKVVLEAQPAILREIQREG